jgi:hypothetical protein
MSSRGDEIVVGVVVIDSDISNEFGNHLKTIYGVDLMPDNVKLIHSRLGMGMAKFKKILKKNIRCENALTYDFSFK